MQRFATLYELLAALHDFKRRYNQRWLVYKHGYCTPNEARALLAMEAAA